VLDSSNRRLGVDSSPGDGAVDEKGHRFARLLHHIDSSASGGQIVAELRFDDDKVSQLDDMRNNRRDNRCCIHYENSIINQQILIII